MSFKLRDGHWEIMLIFFEAHPDLSHGRLKGLNARERAKQLWAELSQKLNSLGFGERSVDKWQKTWTDLKYLMKKKGASSNRDHLSTGGGPATAAPFSKFELRALKLLGKTFFDGLGVQELGLVAEKENEKFRASDINQAEDVLSLVLSVDESQPGSSHPASTPKTNKRIIDHDHDYGMGSAKKVKKTNIEDAYIETIEVLKEIKNCLHAGLADIKDSLDGIRSAIEKNQANT